MKFSKSNRQVKVRAFSEQRLRYGIRKFNVGVASVLVGCGLYLLPATVASAAEDVTVGSEQLLPSIETPQEPPVNAEVTDQNSELALLQINESEAATEDNVAQNRPVDEVAIATATSEPADSQTANDKNSEQQSKNLINGESAISVKDSTELSSVAPVSQSVATPTTVVDEVPSGNFRMHFKQLPSDNLAEMGLWVWGEDVTEPSSNWPQGALRFNASQKTDYGYYIDVPIKPNATNIHYLINNVQDSNKKFTEDLSVPITNPQQRQAWLNERYEASNVAPAPAVEQNLRVHYTRQDGQYDHWGLWVWGDVENPSSNWPQGALDFNQVGPYGRYVDIPLKAGAEKIQFLLVNKQTKEQTRDMMFTDRAHHEQVFLRETETEVYTTPYVAASERLTRAEVTSAHTLELTLTAVDKIDLAAFQKTVRVLDAQQQVIELVAAVIQPENKRVVLTVKPDISRSTVTVTYQDDQVSAQVGWKLKDALYAYDGALGAQLHDDGTATLRLWAPTADKVSAILYDKADQTRELATIPLTKDTQTGVWQVELNQTTTQLADVTGYFYHYAIERAGKTVIALDPYAKSLAEWNQASATAPVAKAALVNPEKIGPALNFAQIPGYTKREDAIIYEAHVRDFTSDPSIAGELKHQFGTFAAFAERLDYLQRLGVTHIQLMPVMSYFFANESQNGERELGYKTQQNNYNWGYDPQSYFSLTGMYSQRPSDPAERIAEFKQLVQAIHERGMGVILDVVYNHTAKTYLFEDLEPNYYHFMNADGTPRESFGGGRLGTTHHMSRRILVDSIKYWTETFKVDGFRFDMMGDHDAAAIQQAYDVAAKLNPNLLMLGEGWRTFVGDEGEPAIPHADQDWMRHTNNVGVFSDEFRNELKSGYPSEGEPRFLTGGKRRVLRVFNNIIANPGNFIADVPGDVVQYIAAHDNLTLHDIIAQSIKKDPKLHADEIHRRIRLGNLIVLTSQGTPFLHAGQEMGRTKQILDPAYQNRVADNQSPYKTHLLTDQNGQPFEYPYFVHDSYDSTDQINRFDWQKATDAARYPLNNATREYTAGLIALRRSTDAFRKGTAKEVADNVKFLVSQDIQDEDNVIAYQAIDSNGDRYVVMVNADNQVRSLRFASDYLNLTGAEVLVDRQQAGTQAIANPVGVTAEQDTVTLQPLTAVVFRIRKQVSEQPTNPVKPVEPEQPAEPTEPAKPVEPEQPAEPIEPAKPVEPEQPVEPADPVQPAEPEQPAEPTNPVNPAEPEQPVEPAEPEQPAEPVQPVEPTDPVQPAEPVQPVEPTDPAKPVEPVQPAEPTDPEQPAEPVQPVEPTNPAKPVEPVQPAEPTDSAKPAEPVQPVEPTDPVKPVEPEQPAEPADPVKPAEPVQPVEPTDPVNPVKPEQPAEPTDPAKPVEPEQPAEPTDSAKPAIPFAIRRQWVDPTSGIMVTLNELETAPVARFEVRKVEGDNLANYTVLKGTLFDLYDLRLVDTMGQPVQLTHPVTVTVLLSAGQQLERVLYLPVPTQAEELEYTASATQFQFEVPHFSEYAFVYLAVAQTANSQTVAAESQVNTASNRTLVSSQQLPATGEQPNAIWLSVLVLVSAAAVATSTVRSKK